MININANGAREPTLWPRVGQTPREWRKQLFSDLAYGMKRIDIWPLADVMDGGSVACSMEATPATRGNEYAGMFKSVRRGFHELGRFDDIIRYSRTAGTARIALVVSETTDIWLRMSAPESWGTFAEAKNTAFLALLHSQLDVHVIIESDLASYKSASEPGHLAQYEVIYSMETHLTRAATVGLAKWVHSGGRLFAMAGALLRYEGAIMSFCVAMFRSYRGAPYKRK